MLQKYTSIIFDCYIKNNSLVFEKHPNLLAWIPFDYILNIHPTVAINSPGMEAVFGGTLRSWIARFFGFLLRSGWPRCPHGAGKARAENLYISFFHT